jgi:putative flippase GtrA
MKINKQILQIATYGAVGMMALIMQSILYIILCTLTMGPVMANYIGTAAGFVISYIGHTRYTFKKQHKFAHREFIKFTITVLIGLLMSSSGIFFIVNVLHKPSIFGIIPILISPIVTFLISRFWAFK